jgi:osmotically inducible protein OsmC
MATRNGSAEWRGDLKGGEGDLAVGDGVFKGAYSFTSRFEEGEGTNPEELIAAAHAACFSMALAAIMAEHGHPAESVRTAAKVHLRPTDAGPTIRQIDLLTEGRVPGIDQDHFAEHAAQAKAGCAVSRALAAVETINVDAKLVS